MKLRNKAFAAMLAACTMGAMPIADAAVYLLKNNKVVAVFPDSQVDAISFTDPGEYDVKTTCEYLYESYYSDALSDVEYTYALELTDMPYDDDGFLPYEATYYMLRLHASELDGISIPVINEGAYTLHTGSGAPLNSIIGGEASYVVTEGVPHYFTEAFMTVEYVDYNTVIHFMGTDEEGVTYSTDFNGKISFQDYSIQWLAQDIHIDGGELIAGYIGDKVRNGANINITLISTGYDEEGWPVTPCDFITFVGNVPLDSEGHIVPGEWPIVDGGYDVQPESFAAGKCVNFLGGSFPTMTNARHYLSKNDVEVGLIQHGTVRVERNADDYVFSYDLTTDKGFKVTGSWTGDLEVENAPVDADPYALEHDVWIDSENMEAELVKRGSDYVFRLYSMNSRYRYDGDFVQIVLQPNDMDALAGNYSFDPSEATAGTLEEGLWEADWASGTYYTLYSADGSQEAVRGAALVSGSVELNDLGDGKWKITFTLWDNQSTPRYVAGEWTGTL